MSLRSQITGFVYYGSALAGGVTEAVKNELAGNITLDAGIRIALAAAISAGVGGLVKEGLSLLVKIIKKKYKL